MFAVISGIFSKQLQRAPQTQQAKMTILKAVKSISKNRLATYRARFDVNTDEKSLGIYMWNKKLCGVFLPVLQLLEVSFRNAIHEGYLEYQKKQLLIENRDRTDLEQKLDREWFKTFFVNNSAAHPESYNHIAQAERALASKQKPKDIDNIISKLPFGFWANLTSKKHDAGQADSLELWPTIRKEVFPGALRGGAMISMKEIQDTIFDINDIRNRIAHHEPIWHAKHLFGQPAFSNKLIRDFGKCLEVIGWINPSNLKTVKLMESVGEFSNLCSEKTISYYMDITNDFSNIIPIDPQAWIAANLQEERHNGEVVNSGNRIIIKSNINNKRFLLDIYHASNPKGLALNVGQKVNFRPSRTIGKKDGKEMLLARNTVLGHI
jgi:hypothetical protein